MGFLGDRDREVLERIGFQDGKRGSGVLRYLSRRLRGEIGAGSDPELALWMARGCCALGDYEHYHMAVRWLERAGRAAGSGGEALGLLALGKMYCGRPEEALAWGEESVHLDGSCPEIWYLLAQLRSFSGDQELALEAVSRGRALGAGDENGLEKGLEEQILPEDWDELERQIRGGCGLEEMERTRIRRRSRMAGEQGGLLEKSRLEAASGLVCDREGLEAVKAVLQPEVWDGDAPYCAFCCWPDGRELTGAFYMDEAAVSKWEPERLQRILSDLPRMEREGKQALAADGAGDGKLCLLELYPDRTLGLVFETESGEKKVPVTEDGRVSREPEETASAEQSLPLNGAGWDFEQLKKDLYLDWGILCRETEKNGVLTFSDSNMRVAVSREPEEGGKICLTAVVLAEEGQQLEAELELERVIYSCRKQEPAE